MPPGRFFTSLSRLSEEKYAETLTNLHLSRMPRRVSPPGRKSQRDRRDQPMAVKSSGTSMPSVLQTSALNILVKTGA